MGISNKITNIVVAATNAVNTSSKVASKATQVSENLFKKTMPELKLADNSAYHTFSPNTKEIVRKIRDFYWQSAKKNNNPTEFSNADSWIIGLTRYGDNEKEVATLLKDTKNLNIYRNIKSQINKDLTKIIPSEYAPAIRTKLTLMALFNKNSFKALAKSKGMKEIKEGRLNIAYLKDIKSTDKIDEDFFYNLFNNIEKQTNKRLVNSGLDVEAVNKYLKVADEKVCQNPNFVNEFISDLEKIQDPELANKILKKCDFNSEFLKYEDKDFRKVISSAALEPEIVEQLLQLKKTNFWGIFHLASAIKDGKNWKISDELFNDYLKFEKANPKQCYPCTLNGLNNMLNTKGVDEKLVKSILANPKLTSETESFNLDKLTYSITEKNLDLLKSCIKKGKFTEKDWFTLKLKGRSEMTDNEISKLYQELQPLNKALNGTNYEYLKDIILDLKINNPKRFQELVDSKILDLIKERKITPRILVTASFDKISPEIYADAKKILNGESLIKKFDSTKNILQKTKNGDVISVNGKMYINNNGRVESWKMTEEKFNELFPLVDRFTTMQGKDDCYFIAALTSLYHTPKTRGNYYKMFEQKGDDIFVTIPAYKDYKGTVRFPKGEIETLDINANAAKNVQMLERAYSRTAVRNANDKCPIGKNPITTDDLTYLQDRINGSRSLSRAIKELYPSATIKSTQDKTQITSALENFANNQRYILSYGYSKGNGFYHANWIKAYNAKAKAVTLVDPECAAIQRE